MPNVTILRGEGNVTSREDLCSKNLYPGWLLEYDGSGNLQNHSTSNGKAARLYAVEDSVIGYDATKAYLSGDRVQYADCAPGVIVLAHLASGQNVARGDYLSSNADGTVKAYAGTAPAVGQADEAANNSSPSNTYTTFSLRFRMRVV